ncbi:hypothetical protein ABTF40_18590, partial [Acinetobacter baumannii]
ENRWTIDSQGNKVDSMMDSRILATTSDNLLNPDIQAQYPTLSMFLSKPITRLQSDERSSVNQEGRVLHSVTNEQLRRIAQQSFANLPPRQLIYTHR